MGGARCDCRESVERGGGLNTADAYEVAADWHTKNARLFEEMSRDPRVGEDSMTKAAAAAIHHAGSAAALRLAALNLRRAELSRISDTQ